jgi:hypothetical protein
MSLTPALPISSVVTTTDDPSRAPLPSRSVANGRDGCTRKRRFSSRTAGRGMATRRAVCGRRRCHSPGAPPRGARRALSVGIRRALNAGSALPSEDAMSDVWWAIIGTPACGTPFRSPRGPAPSVESSRRSCRCARLHPTRRRPADPRCVHVPDRGCSHRSAHGRGRTGRTCGPCRAFGSTDD